MSDYRTLIALFDELRGERVLLRPYQPADAPALFEAVEESRPYLDQWIGFGHGHRSVEQSHDWIIRQQARWLLRDDMPCGIWEIATGRFLGDSRIYPQSWESRYFSLSYWLRRSATGHGYMTEAVRLLTRYAFDELNASRVEIRCDERNQASAGVAQRLGYVQEGRLRNHILAPDGTLRTTIIFARIPEDKA
jgi:RimJ/RimL family protein N-acetyltransferase